MSISVVPFPAREPGRDLLEQPAVAVRVLERGEPEVRRPFRRLEAGRPLLVYLADLDAAADEVVPGGVDVLHREDPTVEGPGLTRRGALPAVDRAPRVGRGELHVAHVVADGNVGVQPLSDALVE